MITIEEFKAIFEKETPEWDGDNVLQGAIIITKYIPEGDDVLTGADHDIIYSVSVEELINGGIEEGDVIALRKLNWMLTDGYLSCFV